VSDPIPVLAAEVPRVVRWAGALARQLRRHDIGLGGKTSGFSDTDALTLADLSVQELLVAALRDMGPAVRGCRIEAEETTGDLSRFADRSEWVLGIDPIDGTREYRDRTGTRYAVMLHARTAETVRYSMVYLPEEGPDGTWLEVRDDRIVLGPDDHARPARTVLDALPPITADQPRNSRRILVSGFLGRDAERAQAVSAAGLEGVLGHDTPGSLFPLVANGYLGGALFHTPNVYDFPVCMHLARVLGGDAIRAHDGRRVDFREVWRDERANMFRLPGIVACATDRRVVTTLVEVARGWSTDRYAR
jgi:3'(2'), 5'-bisphosphate nucleotidase